MAMMHELKCEIDRAAHMSNHELAAAIDRADQSAGTMSDVQKAWFNHLCDLLMIQRSRAAACTASESD